MALENVRKANEVFNPLKIIEYGIHGLGKTSFASTFANPVLMPIEDGAGALDIMAFPRVTTYAELMGYLNELGEGEHDYKTVILDTMDALEPLIWEHTCAVGDGTNKVVNSIEDFGYGKGYIEADKHWREFLSMLDMLRLYKGMNVILIAHSEVKRLEPPDLEPYDRYQMKLHKRSSALCQEWADMVLFLNYKVQVKEQSGARRGTRFVQATGHGDRAIFTTERPAFSAKNRWGLPEEIFVGKDKTFKAFHEALTEATGGKYVR